jgi:hypothetical protein
MIQQQTDLLQSIGLRQSIPTQTGLTYLLQ